MLLHLFNVFAKILMLMAILFTAFDYRGNRVITLTAMIFLAIDILLMATARFHKKQIYISLGYLNLGALMIIILITS